MFESEADRGALDCGLELSVWGCHEPKLGEQGGILREENELFI